MYSGIISPSEIKSIDLLAIPLQLMFFFYLRKISCVEAKVLLKAILKTSYNWRGPKSDETSFVQKATGVLKARTTVETYCYQVQR